MNLKTLARNLAIISSLLLIGAADLSAQSAIYACGHMRRNRTQAINNLRNSGYTTAILFNVNVENDGSLTTDYDWSNQRPAEAGGIICRDGQYTFATYQPNYITDIRSLLTAPTSISRIEICIGGWGNGSYGNIRDLINANGTGPETTLYRNFKALKEAIPEIIAVNNDQEQDYDLTTAIAFHRMLAEIGFKTTVAPYMNRDYWQQLVAALNETPATCDLIYLQTYGGGASNNPSDWKVFGDTPIHIGFDCEASGDLDAMVSNFRNWRDNCGVTGGFLWNYNSEARDLNEWATAINRIFPTKTSDPRPAATFYHDSNYSGYSVGLPEGSYTQADLALYGLKAREISSIEIADGYKVTLYIGANLRGSKTTLTESAPALGDPWNDRARALIIEKNPEGAITAPQANPSASTPITVYNTTGISVLHISSPSSVNSFPENSSSPAPESALSTLPSGIYLLRTPTNTTKLLIP